VNSPFLGFLTLMFSPLPPTRTCVGMEAGAPLLGHLLKPVLKSTKLSRLNLEQHQRTLSSAPAAPQRKVPHQEHLSLAS
jgi:hypothetical protein